MVANSSRISTLIWCALFAAAVARPASAARGVADPNRLFVVERSLNANVVVYDAVRDTHGRLDSNDPVKAYWIMNAEHGQREPLNVIERLEAFGFKVARGPHGDVELTVAALKSRPIRVRVVGRRVEALARIAGGPAVIRKVFVRTKAGHPTQVESVELYGSRPGTGVAVHERLTPG